VKGDRFGHCAPEKSGGMWCGACDALVMAAAPRKRVRTPWRWYRAFERNEAATWGWPKGEIDLEVML